MRCLFVHAKDVDDVLQGINAALWEKADSFQMGTDSWAWASQIARFEALNQIRKYGRDRLVFDDEIIYRLATIAESRLQSFEDRREALSECLTRPQVSIRQTLYRIREALLSCIEGKLALEGKTS